MLKTVILISCADNKKSNFFPLSDRKEIASKQRSHFLCFFPYLISLPLFFLWPYSPLQILAAVVTSECSMSCSIPLSTFTLHFSPTHLPLYPSTHPTHIHLSPLSPNSTHTHSLMAALHTPPPSALKERLHLNSILTLISTVNQHINQFLSDPLARKSLHLQCTTSLTTANAAFLDHSVFSSLYWGIKNLELAAQSKNPEDQAARLAKSEKMLQVPALLDEDGTTMGIANRYIICCTYFYLCLVRKLKEDQWQMTMHFLQSILASPGAVKMELAPELWRSLFQPATTDQEARQQARRYKDWLMYYQVISYGEAPPWNEKRMKNCQ